MISRARYGIEYITRNLDFVMDNSLIEKINRTFDINYDMKDIQLTDDILVSLINQYHYIDNTDINNYIFNEPSNNDGKLFIDIDQKENKIKYCFTDCNLNILNAAEYMQWNIGFGWDKEDFSNDPNWIEIAKVCKDNINAINKDATLMTSIELKQFVTDDYSKQINNMYFEDTIKI